MNLPEALPVRDSGPVLIAYATRYGATAEVARFIAQVLTDDGFPTEFVNVKDAGSVKGCRAVILGTAIRMEKPLPELLSFARSNREALQSRPLFVFSLGAWMRTDTEEHKLKTRQFLRPLLDVVGEPADLALFGGKITYDDLSFFWRMIARRDDSGLMAEGDWRQWEHILAWSRSIAGRLKAEK